MGKAMLTIMAAFAQLERDTMIERTRAGLMAAAGERVGRADVREKLTTSMPPELVVSAPKGLLRVTSRKRTASRAATAYRYPAENGVV